MEATVVFRCSVQSYTKTGPLTNRQTQLRNCLSLPARHLGREVKAADSKSAGLCPRRFESCRCRMFLPHYHRVRVQWPSGLRRSTQVRVSSEAWVRTPPEPHPVFCLHRLVGLTRLLLSLHNLPFTLYDDLEPTRCTYRLIQSVN